VYVIEEYWIEDCCEKSSLYLNHPHAFKSKE